MSIPASFSASHCFIHFYSNLNVNTDGLIIVTHLGYGIIQYTQSLFLTFVVWFFLFQCPSFQLLYLWWAKAFTMITFSGWNVCAHLIKKQKHFIIHSSLRKISKENCGWSAGGKLHGGKKTFHFACLYRFWFVHHLYHFCLLCKFVLLQVCAVCFTSCELQFGFEFFTRVFKLCLFKEVLKINVSIFVASFRWIFFK